MLRTITILFTLTAFHALAYATVPQSCPALFSHLDPATPSRKIENLEDLLSAFSHGLTPDLDKPSHRAAFELYRGMRFGNPNTRLNANSLDEVAQIIKKNPKLEKEAFRDFKLEQEDRTYPVTKELAAFLDSQITSAGQTRANLFQVEANSGYWRKVFLYKDPETAAVAPLPRGADDQLKAAYREKLRAQKDVAQAKWLAYLNAKLPAQVQAELQDTSLAPWTRATALFEVLRKERELMVRDKKDVRSLSQAMVDLIHTIGYHDPAIAQGLKSPDGLERLKAYRSVLDERDRFAMHLGFQDHYDQVLRDIGNPAGVKLATGVSDATGSAQILATLEQGVLVGSQAVGKGSSHMKMIRHLSLVESPFRSCLGGSDCSSRTYLTRALDPNYHYFTLTDGAGSSSGQITVVLGEAVHAGKPVKMAFVDKVQNVPNTDLPGMLEGIRRSVEEKNYVLALPDQVGDHNGLSNDAQIRSFVAKYIGVDSEQALTGFTPHHHSSKFPNKYSRAEQALPSHAVAPLKLAKGVEMIPGELSRSWHTGELDVQKMIQDTENLKDSAILEERLRYIPTMKSLQKAGFKIDPNFDSAVGRWLADSKTPFQLKKQAINYLWFEKAKPLSQIVIQLDPGERTQLLQNLLATPTYRDLIFQDAKNLPELLVAVRGSKNIQEDLLNYWMGTQNGDVRSLVERVLEKIDLPDASAARIIRQLKSVSLSSEVLNYVNAQQAADHAGLGEVFKNPLAAAYLSNFGGQSALGKRLSIELSWERPILEREFVQYLLSQADHPEFARWKILKAFYEIAAIQNGKRSGQNEISFQKAAEEWLKTGKSDSELKALFLLSSLGSRDSNKKILFSKFRAAIPSNQYAAVKSKMDELSNLAVYEKLLTKKRLLRRDTVDPLLYEVGAPESFEFRRFSFPPGGKKVKLGSPENEPGRLTGEALHEATLSKDFEMQATPVTQSQFKLVMQGNSEHFVVRFQRRLNKEISLETSATPVMSVSREQIQAFIDRLNSADPKYSYRLPTNAEWEYACRSGTETPYSFGANVDDLKAYGWFRQASGGRPRPVAALKPNPSGLYDMHGSVDEWVEEAAAVPQAGHGVSSGSERRERQALRGGSYESQARELRSAAWRPAGQFYTTGFRLVRTLK